MSEQKDGGPAFPGLYQENSMSLRDWFAGQAISGCAGEFLSRRDLVAAEAYKWADAMLEARKRD